MRMNVLIEQRGHLPIPMAGRDSTMMDSPTRAMRNKKFSKGRAAEKHTKNVLKIQREVVGPGHAAAALGLGKLGFAWLVASHSSA